MRMGLGHGVVVVTVLAGAVLGASPARAATTEVGPADNLETAWNALGPGDELVLRGGTYDITAGGRFSVDVAGTAAMPIVVRAKDGEHPHVVRTDANQNIIDFVGAQHLTIRGIEFSGGSAGLRFSAGLNVTLEDCEIHSTADVALRANDTGATYEGFRILRNHIHDTDGTGEGMYLGCNNAGCQFKDALIEGNHVHHTNGPTVSQGDGIELKEGSSGNTIRDNVIHDTNYPCILTYSAAGNGGPNIIERNLLFRCGDHGIQAARDAVIRNNIILSAGSDGIAMQPHQSGAPQNLTVVHNTVLDVNGTCISVRGATGSVVVANNALYAMTGNAFFTNSTASFLTVVGNAGLGGVSGITAPLVAGTLAGDFVAASFSGGVPNNVFPKTGSALVAAGNATHVTLEDFNGTARAGAADVGAYVFNAAGNPGWMLAEAFKGATPTLDAGVVPVDAGGGTPDAAVAVMLDGAVRPDAALGMDAGGVVPDAAVVNPADAGAVTGADAATGGGGGNTSRCSCAAFPEPRGWNALAAAAVCALMARWRRRR
jgi:hypothetical protein